mmetsp:Transcript_24895/g.57437  ORF Transcript_24895/g.57437 Transcript_24895/m.57437 type:complete len:611 (-) Transcript_24895:527-2359(-)
MVNQDETKSPCVAPSYPPVLPSVVSYGTSGYRTSDLDALSSLAVRMGSFLVLRGGVGRPSSVRDPGDSDGGEDPTDVDGAVHVGAIVTASHNPPGDNGLKLVDADGCMLHSRWQGAVTAAASATDPASCGEDRPRRTVYLHVGHDTRASSPRLASLLADGARATAQRRGVDVRIVLYGAVPTPVVHRGVASRRREAGEAVVQRYLARLSDGYADLVRLSPQSGRRNARPSLVVDCAMGVGSTLVRGIACALDDLQRRRGNLVAFRGSVVKLLPVNVVLGDGCDDRALNVRCGSDYVQKFQAPPYLHDGSNLLLLSSSSLCCSLDGDADRIVFFFHDSDGKFVLLDGDKISSLLASFIIQQLDVLLPTPQPHQRQLSVAVIQTAYANDASTAYLRSLGVQIERTKTGVMHLHRAAARHDIGVYFESNGHGTILFGSRCRKLVASALASSVDATRKLAAGRLEALAKIMNPAVGDALSDLLAVAGVLFSHSDRESDDAVQAWADMYHDRPSRQRVVKIADRSAIRTNLDETCVTSPPALQAALDAAMRSYRMMPSSLPPRCFVRPSGTEDAVRVYAEADTQRDADGLCKAALVAVQNICDAGASALSRCSRL